MSAIFLREERAHSLEITIGGGLPLLGAFVGLLGGLTRSSQMLQDWRAAENRKAPTG